jgi:hypothetical protein
VTGRREHLDEALAELRTGSLGEAYAWTLYRTVAAVARRYGFPPPEGHEAWFSAAIEEVGNDFHADAHTKKRLATLMVKATDGPSFGRLLERAVRNFLRDRGRATDRGHAMRRLRDVLSADNRFEDVTPGGGPRRWALAGEPSDAVVADPQLLVAAMFTVPDVGTIDWSGQRRGPIASSDDLAGLAEAALRAAAGSVDEPSLVHALERRLGLSFDPTPIDLDETPVADLLQEEPDEPDPDRSAPAEVAAAVLESLSSERDLVILAHLNLPARALGELIGLGRSATNDAQRRVHQRLRDMIGDRGDRDDVLDLVCATARSWYAGRTRQAGSPSDSDTGEGGT